jgi:hypothetical protein
MDKAQVERRLAAILVADIVGYSRLMAEDESATPLQGERMLHMLRSEPLAYTPTSVKNSSTRRLNSAGFSK